jgi:hypothetical protein
MNRRYSILNLILTLVVVTAAFVTTRPSRLDVLDVEQINIVEPDGRVRMVLANRARTPGPIEHGVPFGYPAGRRSGIIFYNDEYTEAGGLIFSGQQDGEHPTAVGSLTFDQFNRDQALALQYVENGGRRRTGLAVTDYPPTVTSAEWVARYEEIQAMTDTADRRAALARWREDGGHGRLWLGRQFDGASVVTLQDGLGRTRLRLRVDSLGSAAIEFLNDSGRVVRRLGPP